MANGPRPDVEQLSLYLVDDLPAEPARQTSKPRTFRDTAVVTARVSAELAGWITAEAQCRRTTPDAVVASAVAHYRDNTIWA